MKITIREILVVTNFTAYSMFVLSFPFYAEVSSFDRIFIAIYSALLCSLWGSRRSCHPKHVVHTLVYGLIGCPAACLFAFSILYPTLASLVSTPILLLAYVATLSGGRFPTENRDNPPTS